MYISLPLTLSDILTFPSPLENLISLIGIRNDSLVFLFSWISLSIAFPSSLQLSKAIIPNSCLNSVIKLSPLHYNFKDSNLIIHTIVYKIPYIIKFQLFIVYNKPEY